MEVLVLLAVICFCLLALFIIIFAILDYKYEKRAFEERCKIEREMKFLGYYWRNFDGK